MDELIVTDTEVSEYQKQAMARLEGLADTELPALITAYSELLEKNCVVCLILKHDADQWNAYSGRASDCPSGCVILEVVERRYPVRSYNVGIFKENTLLNVPMPFLRGKKRALVKARKVVATLPCAFGTELVYDLERKQFRRHTK